MADEFGRHVAGSFGGRVRRRRRTMGVSQEELPFRAGVHRTRVSLIEHGKVVVRIDTLILLARALDLTETQLLAGIEESAVECRIRRPHEAPRGGCGV